MGAKSAKPKASWKCPKCGREFARKSSFHGCGDYSLEGYLAGKKAAGVALFNLLAEAARQFEGVTISAAKTQIMFRAGANFMMVGVSGTSLTGYLFLPRAVPKPYFKKIVAASSRRQAHVFRISDDRTLRDLIELMPEAIALVTEKRESAEVAAEKKLRIGEEINALYRAERKAAAERARL